MQKSKILAFLLALVVSIVLWFYAVTVVNPDDTITISGISVQFEGTEALTSQGLMLTGGDSTKVSIKVSGRRSDLKELNNETVTAIADVTRIAASGSYQLSWSVVWPSTVATGDISETSRAPSRISVTVSDIKENPEVPIELEYTGEPKTGYMIDKSNLTLGTQSISVRGPAEEVNKIARAVVRVDVTDADALIDTRQSAEERLNGSYLLRDINSGGISFYAAEPGQTIPPLAEQLDGLMIEEQTEPSAPQTTQATQAATGATEESATEAEELLALPRDLGSGLTLQAVLPFSGPNVDADGAESDQLATIIVQNDGGMAVGAADITLTCEDGAELRFRVTDLPVGGSCYAFELNSAQYPGGISAIVPEETVLRCMEG